MQNTAPEAVEDPEMNRDVAWGVVSKGSCQAV